MPQPSVSQSAENLYEILKPLAYADERYGWPLLHLCEASVGSLQQVNNYVGSQDDEFPNWSALVDIDRAPDETLPWLGQLVGVVVPRQEILETDSDYAVRIREYIRGTPGFKRGSPSAMVVAVQQYLTGTKQVIFRERNGGAYKLTVKTRRDETPPEDWESTNILTNGGLETNTTGWSVVNGTIARIVSPGKFGDAYGAVTCTAPTVFTAIHDSPISGATAGREFSGSVWARGVGAQIGEMCGLGIEERGGASGAVSFGFDFITLTEDWQRVTASGPIAANDRTTARLFIDGNNASPGEIFHIDGAQMEEKPDATPYIETNGAPASRGSGFGPVGDALRTQKPGGIILTYEVIDGQDWQNVIDTQASWTTTIAAYPTIDALEEG